MNNKSFTHIKIVREIGYKYTDYTMFYEQRNNENTIVVSVPAYSILIDNNTNKILGSDWQVSDVHTKNQIQSLTFVESGVEVGDAFYSWFANNTLATDEMIIKKIENTHYIVVYTFVDKNVLGQN